jgi:hypothetical protein
VSSGCRAFDSLADALGAPDLPTGGVLAVLPRGETFRNFVYSGVLERVRREVGAGAISVLPSAQLSGLLQAHFDYLLPLEAVKDARAVHVLREILDLAHGRWLDSAAARDRWRRRVIDVPSTRRRRRWWLKKWLARPFAGRRRLYWLSRRERRASRRRLRDDVYLRLLERLAPSLVFNASHVHSANAIHAVQAAQWLGIRTATFIFSWDNLTSQGRILLPYDDYLVWNVALRDDLLSMYPHVRADQVHVTGTPQFDAHFDEANAWTRAAYCEAVGADPARPIVLYTTGMPNHMPGEPALVEEIADLLPATASPAPQLLVRVYPKDRSGRFEDLAARRPDILFPRIPWAPEALTPLPEDAALWSNMLRHAAVGINVASTVSLELMMFAKPVINVAYDPPDGSSHLPYARYYDFDHYRPLVACGSVALAGSAAELAQQVATALSSPDVRASERSALLRRMFGETLDGRSGERVADVLLRLAGP